MSRRQLLLVASATGFNLTTDSTGHSPDSQSCTCWTPGSCSLMHTSVVYTLLTNTCELISLMEIKQAPNLTGQPSTALPASQIRVLSGRAAHCHACPHVQLAAIVFPVDVCVRLDLHSNCMCMYSCCFELLVLALIISNSSLYVSCHRNMYRHWETNHMLGWTYRSVVSKGTKPRQWQLIRVCIEK